jgi:hypothetical protein
MVPQFFVGSGRLGAGDLGGSADYLRMPAVS